jgi:hypothetical protein
MTSRAFSVIGGEKDGLDSIGDCRVIRSGMGDKSKVYRGFYEIITFYHNDNWQWLLVFIFYHRR